MLYIIVLESKFIKWTSGEIIYQQKTPQPTPLPVLLFYLWDSDFREVQSKLNHQLQSKLSQLSSNTNPVFYTLNLTVSL